MKFKHFLFFFLGLISCIVIPIASYNAYVNWQPIGSEVGEEVPVQGRQHVPVGTVVIFTTNPPASGPHYSVPEVWGIKIRPIQDEYAVHSMEHGTVWITYQPDKISVADLRQLKDIANQYARIILSPRPSNDAYIALVSWGRIEKLDHMDVTAINLFAYRNRNHGPERWVMDSFLVVWVLRHVPQLSAIR